MQHAANIYDLRGQIPAAVAGAPDTKATFVSGPCLSYLSSSMSESTFVLMRFT